MSGKKKCSFFLCLCLYNAYACAECITGENSTRQIRGFVLLMFLLLLMLMSLLFSLVLMLMLVLVC